MGDDLLFRIPALLIALTVHEYSHGRVAYHLGDGTAKMHGRLTLNPVSHLDPIGLIMLWFVGFGWAKPVPVNPVNFRRDLPMKQGLLYVSLAGPLSNLVMAFIFIGFTDFFIRFFMNITPTNFMMIINPQNPLNPAVIQDSVGLFVLSWIIILNVYLAIFNLLPIPPLDGSKILRGLLPREHEHIIDFLNQYGFIILILLIFTGVIGNVLIPLANRIMELMYLPFNLFNFL